MGYCTIFGTVARSFYDTIFTLVPASHLLPAQKAVLLVFPLQREFDVKNIERTAEICYNENNHKLKNRKAVFYGTNSNFL